MILVKTHNIRFDELDDGLLDLDGVAQEGIVVKVVVLKVIENERDGGQGVHSDIRPLCETIDGLERNLVR